MIRVCSLGSGSTGNATLVEARDGTTTTRVLVDCGFSARELSTRLGRAGLAVEDIDAIFVTHEHGDHVGCSLAVAQRHRVALWMSRGTWRAVGEPAIDSLRFARDGEAFAVGDLELLPYTVPHDAAEPLQICFFDGAHRLGVLTDAGSITPHMRTNLAGCSGLVLECNHDCELLAASRYPASLKARVGGRYGHLSNEMAAVMFAAVAHAGLQFVVAAHLSQENNRPELARRALAGAVGTNPADIRVAGAGWGFDWLELH